MHSLVNYQQARPALAPSVGFAELFQSGYWTSTTAAINITRQAVDWQTAFEAMRTLNRMRPGKKVWRLPNINELESLVDADRAQPALPVNHPFESPRDVYWSSTTSLYQPDWAWALYLDKGALGVGQIQEARFYEWVVTGPVSLDAMK